MDMSVGISDDEAEEWRRTLAHREGLYVGYSAAANVCAAAKLLASGRLTADAVVATVLCDTGLRSEEHTSELQSLMRISYAVFCFQKKQIINIPETNSYKPETTSIHTSSSTTHITT